jgi:hypothetical protein
VVANLPGVVLELDPSAPDQSQGASHHPLFCLNSNNTFPQHFASSNPNVKALADAEQYTLALTQLEDLTGFRKRLQAIITPYSIESHQK